MNYSWLPTCVFFQLLITASSGFVQGNIEGENGMCLCALKYMFTKMT